MSAPSDGVPDWFTGVRPDLDDWVEAHAGTRAWTVRHTRDWSVVGRVDDRGPWVKAAHPDSRHEVTVLEVLGPRVPDHLPVVLASDRSRGWLLLADGGPVLRSLEGGPGVAPDWRATLAAYATVQRASEAVADDLVAGGVPDARGSTLVDRFDDLFGDDGLMGRGQPWGLSPDDDRHLTDLRPRLTAWAQELAHSGIAPAVQHDDLHGNNVFTTGPRIFDWGDAAVSHPFLSLTATLRSIPHHTPALANRLDDLVEPYLATWSDVVDPTSLGRTVQVARHVGAVLRALSWARALQHAPADHPDREAAPGWLGELLAPLPHDLADHGS